MRLRTKCRQRKYSDVRPTKVICDILLKVPKLRHLSASPQFAPGKGLFLFGVYRISRILAVIFSFLVLTGGFSLSVSLLLSSGSDSE